MPRQGFEDLPVSFIHHGAGHRPSGSEKCSVAKQFLENSLAFLVDIQRLGEIDDQRLAIANGSAGFPLPFELPSPSANQLPFNLEGECFRTVVNRYL